MDVKASRTDVASSICNGQASHVVSVARNASFVAAWSSKSGEKGIDSGWNREVTLSVIYFRCERCESVVLRENGAPQGPWLAPSAHYQVVSSYRVVGAHALEIDFDSNNR